MTTTSRCKQITIFEGPDAGGKTTVAQAYAKLMCARYIHFSNLPNVNQGLARIYVEAMLPALLGYQDVVLDRCWLSEVPYGTAFRGGADRLGVATCRMLERLALRCGAVVVKCLPPFETVKDVFMKRLHDEYLEHETQLQTVYQLYDAQHTSLPELRLDYTQRNTKQFGVLAELAEEIHACRDQSHFIGIPSAGNLAARVILVGEKFISPKDQDPFYQWPFASFSGNGCSRWLAEQLAEAGIQEHQLLWLNADVLSHLDKDQWTELFHDAQIVAMGGAARELLLQAGCQDDELIKVDHPQAHKRFHSKEAYPLIQTLKELLHV